MVRAKKENNSEVPWFPLLNCQIRVLVLSPVILAQAYQKMSVRYKKQEVRTIQQYSIIEEKKKKKDNNNKLFTLLHEG